MSNKNTLVCDDIAEILNTTPAAIRMALHRGQEGETIPPSFKLGNRRLWLRVKVDEWLIKKSNDSANDNSRCRLGRPRAPATGNLRRDIKSKTPRNNSAKKNLATREE